MLDVAQVRPHDYVIDLGSGDGRIVIAAARRGAAGHGVELDPDLVELARTNARAEGVTNSVAFVEGDIFEADIRSATVVTLYLFPEANIQLRPKLLAELRPGTRVVSNSFHMEDWLPDVHDMSARSSGGILLWIIPARIEGDWFIEIDGDARYALAAKQSYQDIELELAGSGPLLAVKNASLEGNRIRFEADDGRVRFLFDGIVDENGMQGFVHVERAGVHSVSEWRAIRSRAYAEDSAAQVVR